MRKSKGRPDLRRIRLNQSYIVLEVAGLLEVSNGTVRTWIRKGLPVLNGGKPILIPGDGLKLWLKARRGASKQKCLPDELYCCRCRRPRKTKTGSVEIVRRNAKTAVIRAPCGSCGAKMNRAGSLAKIEEIKAVFGLNTGAQVNLAECEAPAVNQHLEMEAVR